MLTPKLIALWTRSMIRELIRDECDVRLSDVSVGRLLRKLGLSPQKPLYRAYEQDAQVVERWCEEEYPAMKKRAQRLGATIYLEDESAVSFFTLMEPPVFGLMEPL